MPKLTKVFGAIFCFLGFVAMTVTTFMYLNSSAHLDYNTAKQLTFIKSGYFIPFLLSTLILVFGILFAKDKVIESNHH